MTKEKISDFVDVWAETIGLKETRYINLIKSDIAKRCNMYEDTFPTISTKDDSCDAYIIKPVNGEYSLEDFFLNRLMLGLREIDFGETFGFGAYNAADKQIWYDFGLIDSRVNDTAKHHPGLNGKNVQIAKKSFEHELGHCLKSSFTDGFKAQIGMGREQDTLYKELINNLSKYQNGKYASKIKQIQEFKLNEESKAIKTGVKDSENIYGTDIDKIDELLNEIEALELTNSNEIHDKKRLRNEQGINSNTGNYVNVYNYISGYSTMTGYGDILKTILGKEDSFFAEYISSKDILKNFDREYSDIVQDVWGLDPKKMSPTRCLCIDFNDLVMVKHFDEKIMLKLDEFFAKCYERKVEKSITQGQGTLSKESIEKVLKDIEQFQARLTTNDDPKKREQLAHNVVFNNIKTRMNELELQNKQPKSKVDKSIVEPNNSNTIADEQNKKMKFVNGFIKAYNDTESEYQYEERAKFDSSDVKRVQEIISTNGMNKMLLLDLNGKWIESSEDEDKKMQYAEKQVSAMSRLLKAAQLLTQSKKLNPNGKNYLEEFVNVPEIDYKLLQMHEDLKDQNSYIYEMRQRARENRANGTIPSYPKTQTEIDAEDTPIINEKKLEPGKVRKLPMNNVKNTISQSQVTMSEMQNQTNNMGSIFHAKALQFKKMSGKTLSTDEQLLLNQQNMRRKQAIDRYKSNQQGKTMSL
jgi:hypothetical protein